MVEYIKETVAGLRLGDKGAETGTIMTTTGVNQDREETAGDSRTQETNTGIEDEGEDRTEERTEICFGTPLMATHTYTENLPYRKGYRSATVGHTRLQERTRSERTLVVSRRQKWGHVGYALVALLVVIADMT